MAEDAQQVVRSVVLDADAGDVWRALTDDGELSAWFGGDVVLDVRPGGGGRFQEPDGGARRAVVEEVDDGARLVWRWWEEGAGATAASRVELTVEQVDGGTRLTVVEAPVAARPTGGGLRAARAAAWDRRLLALELRSLGILAAV